MIPSSKSLIDSYFLTLLYKFCCHKLPQTYTLYSCRFQIPAKTLFCLFALVWCSNLVVICEKHYEFSIFLTISACKLAFLQDVEPKNGQKIWFLAYNFV